MISAREYFETEALEMVHWSTTRLSMNFRQRDMLILVALGLERRQRRPAGSLAGDRGSGRNNKCI